MASSISCLSLTSLSKREYELLSLPIDSIYFSMLALTCLCFLSADFWMRSVISDLYSLLMGYILVFSYNLSINRSLFFYLRLSFLVSLSISYFKSSFLSYYLIIVAASPSFLRCLILNALPLSTQMYHCSCWPSRFSALGFLVV